MTKIHCAKIVYVKDIVDVVSFIVKLNPQQSIYETAGIEVFCRPEPAS